MFRWRQHYSIQKALSSCSTLFVCSSRTRHTQSSSASVRTEALSSRRRSRFRRRRRRCTCSWRATASVPSSTCRWRVAATSSGRSFPASIARSRSRCVFDVLLPVLVVHACSCSILWCCVFCGSCADFEHVRTVGGVLHQDGQSIAASILKS